MSKMPMRARLNVECLEDRTMPSNLSLVGSVPLNRWNGDVYAFGNYAYIGTWTVPCSGEGVKIVDATDPAHPVHIGNVAAYPDSSAEDMEVIHVNTPFFKGDLLGVGLQNCELLTPTAVANGRHTHGLDLWDVTDPYRPVFLGYFSTAHFEDVGGGGVHELTLFHRPDLGRVFAGLTGRFLKDDLEGAQTRKCCANSRVWLVDITDPRRPVQVADWDYRRDIDPNFAGDTFSHESVSVNQAGTLAYVSYWEAGTIILDIANPSQPRFVGRAVPPGLPNKAHSAIETDGGKVLVTTYEDFEDPKGYPRLWNIEDPAHPIEIGSFQISGAVDPVHNPVVRGNRLFLSWYRDGLRVLDISNPSAPQEIASWKPSQFGSCETVFGTVEVCPGIWGVYVQGDLIYLSDEGYGLWILKMTPEKSTVQSTDSANAPAEGDSQMIDLLLAESEPTSPPPAAAPATALTDWAVLADWLTAPVDQIFTVAAESVSSLMLANSIPLSEDFWTELLAVDRTAL